jgi:hypothetical protein
MVTVLITGKRREAEFTYYVNNSERGGGGSDQWGRKLEGWFNTAARLAGWRRVTRQVWSCLWWAGRTVCLFRTVLVALTWAAQLRADGIYSCCYVVNVHNHPSWAMSHKEGMAWYSSRSMPSLWEYHLCVGICRAIGCSIPSLHNS